MTEWIKNFVTAPELPDYVAYILMVAMAIGQVFVKKFVAKDNAHTLSKVETKTQAIVTVGKELRAALDEFRSIQAKIEAQAKADSELVREELKKAREENKLLEKKLMRVKSALSKGVANDKYLVSNGYATEILKELGQEETKESNKNGND